jgi:hypothetical protein
MAIGVQVDTVLPPSGGGANEVDPRTFFITGLAERGDTVNPILIRSSVEARSLLGDRVTYGALADQIDAFFGEAGENGGRVVAARVVGPAATTGFLVLQDRAAVPVNTLRLNAASAGAWSSGITAQVADGTAANTFTLTIRYDDDVEVFPDLASPAAAVTALAASSYVRGQDLGSASAPPANNPAVLAATALSAGTDDRAAVTATELVAALDRFGKDLGPGVVAIPGQPHTTVAAGLAAHARTYGRVALTAPGLGTSPTAAGSAARALRTAAGADYLGFLYLWQSVPDGAGGTRQISPEGIAAGLRARLDRTWAAPAGEAGITRYSLGTERALTAEEINTLDADAVTTFREVLGGVRLYGWRSLSLNTADFRNLSTRDYLNELAFRGRLALERFAHATIDGKGQLFQQVNNELIALVAADAAAGALFAGADDPGYRVDTGPGVNTPESIAAGEVRAVLAVRQSPIGSLVRLTIRKVQLTAAL